MFFPVIAGKALHSRKSIHDKSPTQAENYSSRRQSTAHLISADDTVEQAPEGPKRARGFTRASLLALGYMDPLNTKGRHDPAC
jgi:hypothetical protein